MVVNTRTIKKLSAPLIAAVLSIGAAACGASDDSSDASSGDATEQPASDEVTVTDAWVREPADGQTLAAGYGTVTNGSDDTITLIGASAPITAIFEIHETSVSDEGTMSMSEKDGGFEIAAGESFTLEPGGPHVMMMGIDPAEFGGPIDLTFLFDSTEVTVEAELRSIGDATEMDDDSMEEMEDGDS
jgi:copper(I)-binding protein